MRTHREKTAPSPESPPRTCIVDRSLFRNCRSACTIPPSTKKSTTRRTGKQSAPRRCTPRHYNFCVLLNLSLSLSFPLLQRHSPSFADGEDERERVTIREDMNTCSTLLHSLLSSLTANKSPFPPRAAGIGHGEIRALLSQHRSSLHTPRALIPAATLFFVASSRAHARTRTGAFCESFLQFFHHLH